MAKSKGAKIVFRRIRGRIIPIRSKGNVRTPLKLSENQREMISNAQTLRKSRRFGPKGSKAALKGREQILKSEKTFRKSIAKNISSLLKKRKK